MKVILKHYLYPNLLGKLNLGQFWVNVVVVAEAFKGMKNIIIQNNIPVNTIVNNWPDALRVIVYNILINAYKSTEKGVISISIVKKASNYTIKIKDNGVGMNASMLRYLITGKSKDEVENFAKYKKGNGVGYQIIRNIVKLMKAKLEIESRENVGTTVSLLFIN